MKLLIASAATCILLFSCATKAENNAQATSPKTIKGTWRLLTGTLIEKGDTTVTDYTKKYLLHQDH